MSITPLGALTLCLVMLPLAALPSASVALVVARSVGAGRASGAFAALGIVVGDLVFVTVALLGMRFLAGWLGTLFSLLKYGGGAYLVWLGVGVLRSAPARAMVHPGRRAASFVADFAAGLLLTLGDVKAILFYASLFPALVEVDRLGGWDMLLIAAITAVTVGGVKLMYVGLAARIVDELRGRVPSGASRTLAGMVMMGCGFVLIVKA